MNPTTTIDSGSSPDTSVPSDLQRRLAARVRAARAAVNKESTIPPRDPQQPARLSLAEEQLWYLDQFLGGTATYNIGRAWRLRGPLDRTALRRSVDDLVQRHAGLRTTIVPDPHSAVRVVRSDAAAAWSVIDCSGWPEEFRATEAIRLARVCACEPFDLGVGPLVRFQLIVFGPQDHALAITLHHIIADGWSLGLMLRELSLMYRAHGAGVTAELRPLERDFADFAVWQHQQARANAFASSIAYWEQKLRGAPAMLELPTDRARPAAPSFRGALARVSIPAERLRPLAALGASEGTSLFVVLLAAFKVLLYRHSGQEELVVGSPFASRNQPVLESIVGYFANMLPLRTSLTGNATFREVLRRVRQCVLEAADHQDVPFAAIVERVRPTVRHAGLNPIFQAAFVLEEQGLVGSPDLVGTRAEMLSFDTGTAKFDVSLLIIDTGNGLEMTLEAAADLFETETAERLLAHYQHLLESVANAPDVLIDRAPLIGAAERTTILQEWSGARTEYPRQATVHGLFADVARRRPQAIALVCGERTITYAELNQAAARLARRLRDKGVRTGDFVAIGADRSIAFVVGVLATLKAGAAYVPLDVRNPRSWLTQMLDAVRPALVLVAPHYREALPPMGANLMLLEESSFAPSTDEVAIDDDAPAIAASPAYVMFTSGSTGRAKGTVVPHRAIVRLVRGTSFVRFAPDDVFLLLANLAFDASTFEMWGPLLNGARLAIPTSPQPTLAQIAAAIRQHGVTTLWLTSGLFNLIVEERVSELASVRQLLAGGDVLSPAHVAKALAALPQTRLINGYGPTENTVFTCCHTINSADILRRSIPIGRPIANTRVYILDAQLQPVAPGVPGELYAGGDGLAQGYLNQPELTEERFIPDPFSEVPGAHLYRTGDRCRWRHDGTIEFLGRIDQELKIRGFRVDTGEIEGALARLPGVAEAIVLARPGPTGDKELIAFVVAANGAALVPSQLREQLAAHLPPHMVPAAFHLVAAMPLTSNGKVDRRVLASMPADGVGERGDASRVAPRTETERRLQRLWSELLRRETVSVTEDFFALGGHSLLAMRLMHRVHEEFGRALPLAALLSAPTIEQLAARITLAGPDPAPVATPVVAGLRGSGTGTPLFFIPGLGGYEFLPAPVARALDGTRQYFDALQIVGVDKQRTPLEDLRHIATDLVQQIRAVRPEGPYHLCGYCYGGVVAFEVARQLEAAGESVPALVIWHGYPVTKPWPRRSLPAVARAIGQRLRETPPGERPRLLWEKFVLAARMLGWRLNDEWNHLLRRPRSLIPHNVFFPEEMDPRVVYANLRARGRYQPGTYHGRVFLLMGDTDRLIYDCPPLAGWDGVLLGNVEIFKHPVEHMELVVPPAVDFIAAQTAACLAAADNGVAAIATRGFTGVASAATSVRRVRE